MKTTTRTIYALTQASLATISTTYLYKIASHSQPQEASILISAFLMGLFLLLAIIGYFASYLNLKQAIEEHQQWKNKQKSK